jgi:hypothetical protein
MNIIMNREDILEIYDSWTAQRYEVVRAICGLRIRRKIK